MCVCRFKYVQASPPNPAPQVSPLCQVKSSSHQLLVVARKGLDIRNIGHAAAIGLNPVRPALAVFICPEIAEAASAVHVAGCNVHGVSVLVVVAVVGVSVVEVFGPGDVDLGEVRLALVAVVVDLHLLVFFAGRDGGCGEGNEEGEC